MTSGALIAAPVVAAMAGVAGATYASVAPACSIWGPVISRGSALRSAVALTFDDGPTPGTTNRVLDELREVDALATFFVIGIHAAAHPDLLRRIRDEGHEIANHSMRHSHYGMMRLTRYWKDEIRRTDDVIESILGKRPRIFRPPMGVKTWHVTAAVRENGHTLVTWSRRAMDGIRTTPERILKRLGDAGAGEILLLHDGVEPHAPHRNREATIAAIGPLVQRLRERDLEPVQLSPLLAPCESPVCDATK